MLEAMMREVDRTTTTDKVVTLKVMASMEEPTTAATRSIEVIV
jgi:hypothetical protein